MIKKGDIVRLDNERHERFCAEYLIDLNATKAAERAGYSARSAGNQGNRLMKKAEIQERITEMAQEARSEAVADATEVMEYLTAVMRGEAEGGSRVRAAELLAKRYGLLKDKTSLCAAERVIIIDDI